MLSIEKVKELLKDKNISDEEAEEIKDGCRNLSEVIFENWQEAEDQKKEEASMLAGALLDAEAKIGEILKSRSTATFKKGGEKNLPIGITKHQSSAFQTFAENKDIIEQT